MLTESTIYEDIVLISILPFKFILVLTFMFKTGSHRACFTATRRVVSRQVPKRTATTRGSKKLSCRDIQNNVKHKLSICYM